VPKVHHSFIVILQQLAVTTGQLPPVQDANDALSYQDWELLAQDISLRVAGEDFDALTWIGQ
jgi:hypothetical protein